MESILLQKEDDRKFAIEVFGSKYKSDIKKAINNEYPCFIIGHYSDDIEFGSGYTFKSISIKDFDNTKPKTVIR